MFAALLWPVVLLLIYGLLFAFVLILARRFTRDSTYEEPIADQSGPEERTVGVGTRHIA